MQNSRPPADLPESEERFIRKIIIFAAFLVLGLAIWLLKDVLLLLFAGILLAIVIRSIAEPLISKLAIPQGVAITLAVLTITFVISSGIFLFTTRIGAQLDALLHTLPSAASGVLERLGFPRVQDLLTGTAVGNVLTTAYEWGTALFAVASGILFVIFTGIYLSISPGIYKRGLVLLFPPRVQPQVEETIDNVGRSLGLWLGGQLIAMVLVGCTTAAGLWLIGHEAPLALGFISGVAEFVPIVGPIAGAIPGLLAASGGGLEMVIWTLAVYVIVQQIESNIIMPLIVGNAVEIPPAVGLFAVIALGVLLGPLGVLFAYPLAVVANVAIRRLYVREVLGEDVKISGEKPEA